MSQCPVYTVSRVSQCPVYHSVQSVTVSVSGTVSTNAERHDESPVVFLNVSSKKCTSIQCSILQTQSKFLLERIRRCKNTAFGRDNHLSSFRSVGDFRRTFPVCDFSSVENYINRMANGEQGTLFGDGDEVVMFVTSSGTTGKNKVMPASVQSAKDMHDQVYFGAYPRAVQEVFPWDLTKILAVSNSPSTHKRTVDGHKIGMASGLVRGRAKNFL